MGKIDKLKRIEIFNDDWTKKINFLGLALKTTRAEESGIILLKSHGNIYGLNVRSDKIDMGFDSYIENTEYKVSKYYSLLDFRESFNNDFITFLPFSNSSKEIIISEEDGWYNFNFVEVLLDMKPYEFFSSIINITSNLEQVNYENFIDKISQEFPLEKIIEYNKTTNIPIKTKMKEKER